MHSSSKIFHIFHDRQGLSETYQEFNSDPFFSILCDALIPLQPEKSTHIAKDFERVIKKYLWQQKPHLTEKVLLKALEHAQKHFLQKYATLSDQLKLSVLILAQPERALEDKPYLYVVGLGDFKLFQLERPPTLLFYDPETPKLPLDLSIKKRFPYLSNAVGAQTFKAHFQKIEIQKQTALLALSYGTYSFIPEEKWIQYASEFENKKNQILRSISRSKEKDHLKHFLYLSFEEEKVLTSQKTQPREEAVVFGAPQEKINRYLPSFYWAFKIAVVTILGLCILELSQYPSFMNVTKGAEHVKLSIKEPKMRLHLKAVKKGNRFPLIRERAYIVDLKEKSDQQMLIIEKLNDRIRQQDQAIRDLQLKAYCASPLSSDPTTRNTEIK